MKRISKKQAARNKGKVQSSLPLVPNHAILPVNGKQAGGKYGRGTRTIGLGKSNKVGVFYED